MAALANSNPTEAVKLRQDVTKYQEESELVRLFFPSLHSFSAHPPSPPISSFLPLPLSLFFPTLPSPYLAHVSLPKQEVLENQAITHHHLQEHPSDDSMKIKPEQASLTPGEPTQPVEHVAADTNDLQGRLARTSLGK